MQLGTWLHRVFQALGGELALDEEALENLRLLWRCLDGLPNGEQDLLDPSPDAGVRAALKELSAQPDPRVSEDFGVQLMTIHKSKGLEFEVVVLMDLEAEAKQGDRTLISWLERGVAEADGGAPETEFLIAPIPPQGQPSSKAKALVDGILQERERQEMRRLLYVAMTRAKRQLHVYVRTGCGEKDGAVVLKKPRNSLLATIWPAWEARIQEQFGQWVQRRAVAGEPGAEAAAIDLAAADSGKMLAFPAGGNGAVTGATAMTRRVPVEALPGVPLGQELAAESTAAVDDAPYERTQGGLESRVFGKAVHQLLDTVSRLRARLAAAEAAQALDGELAGLRAEIRGAGFSPQAARQMAERAVAVARRASLSEVGSWILAPHEDADSEARWSGMVADGSGSRLRNLRPDRIFRAAEPGDAGGAACWWIVDYKTASGAGLENPENVREFLAEHRRRYEAQLATYAALLREWKRPEIPIRAAIFYPIPVLFDSWLV
jgi:ATP-dependent exoDNAse (exonuclease V) beta subunit